MGINWHKDQKISPMLESKLVLFKNSFVLPISIFIQSFSFKQGFNSRMLVQNNKEKKKKLNLLNLAMNLAR